MKDNRTAKICDSCNSHIITYQDEDGKIIIECSYCGEAPEDILLPFEIEEEEVEDES